LGLRASSKTREDDQPLMTLDGAGWRWMALDGAGAMEHIASSLRRVAATQGAHISRTQSSMQGVSRQGARAMHPLLISRGGMARFSVSIGRNDLPRKGQACRSQRAYCPLVTFIVRYPNPRGRGFGLLVRHVRAFQQHASSHPVLPSEQPSQGHVPRPNEVHMQ